MRKFSVLFFLLVAITSNAATYYFSSSYSGYNGTPNGTIDRPYTTLDNIASIVSTAGDKFLLKRGDIFYQTSTIAPTESGTSSLPIVIGEYGTGAKPVISAWKRIISWTNIAGTNKWFATGVKGVSSDITMVRMGATQSTATFQNIGRWPNSTQLSGVDSKSYGGYLDLESKSTSNTHTYDTVYDNNYTADMSTRPTDNWAGAEIAIRTSHFRFNSIPIVSSTLSGSKMIYRYDRNNSNNFDNSWDNLLVGWGYFIQNHEKTLDVDGEWCYDKTADKLTIYSLTDPNNLWVEVPAVNNVFELKTSSDISHYLFSNLDITGANNDLIYMDGNADNIDIDSCNLTYAGNSAIELGLPDVKDLSGRFIDITNNYISMCMMYGISQKSYQGIDAFINVKDNYIRDIMPVRGMGLNGNVPGTGMDLYGNNILVEYNSLHNIAYVGIDINDGSNQRVTKNFGDSVNVRIDDGGGLVYTANLKDKWTYRNKVIDSNIAINSHLPEVYLGLPRIYNSLSNTMSFPFYGDKWSNRWKFKGNIAVKPQRGFYINDAKLDTLDGNVVYDPYQQGVHLHNTAALDADTNHVISYNLGINNVFYSNSSGTSPTSAEYFDADKNAGNQPLGYGTFQDNNFAYPFLQTADNYFKANGTRKTWGQWDSTYKYDHIKNFFKRTNPTGSNTSNISMLIYNNTKKDSIVTLLNKTWIDPATNKQYLTNKDTLKPFTGKVLIYTGSTSIANPSISLTANNTSLTASSNVTLSATANSNNTGGNVKKVEFYANTTLLTTITTSVTTNPYTYQWNNIAAGNYDVKAVVTDELGNTSTSAIIKVSVTDPVIINQPDIKLKKTRFRRFSRF